MMDKVTECGSSTLVLCCSSLQLYASNADFYCILVTDQVVKLLLKDTDVLAWLQ